MTMTIEQVIKSIKFEIDRAHRDAEMSTSQEDLDYHNGEYDALNFMLEVIETSKESN
jgi:hypothetical protein